MHRNLLFTSKIITRVYVCCVFCLNNNNLIEIEPHEFNMVRCDV